MKALKISLLIIILSTATIFQLQAQALEEVVYLKNGNIYRGTIIEQIPNVSLKIQTIGGNVFSVSMDEVAKITKEAALNESPAPRNYQPRTANEGRSYHSYAKDSTRKQYTFRKKGYFFQGQILLENLQGGLRIVNGYKFGRFGYLGIGVGFDLTLSSPINGDDMFSGGSGDYSGVYLPLYLYYAGDILKKRITPFYAFEAGYTFSPTHASGPFSQPEYYSTTAMHGPMGMAGFGVKFNTKRRVNFNLLLNMNFKHISFSREYAYYDTSGNYYMVNEQNRAFLLFPGLRFGLGF